MGLQKLWYQPTLHPLLWPLVPLSYVYSFLISLRAAGYALNFPGFQKIKCPIPIIVVGNLTVGGAGKTPLVIHLVHLLRQHGMRPGIVSRGYGGNHQSPGFVFANSDPNILGDEPILLAKRLSCPIVVAKKRVEAVNALLDTGQVDVVISDDGLQHTAMLRDIEIVVLDGKRRFGNGWCLPAGPLRESLGRLKKVDFIVSKNPDRFDMDNEYEMELRPRALYQDIPVNSPLKSHPSSNLHPHSPLNAQSNTQRSLDFFRDKTVHAVAGIGFPERFFETLRQQRLLVIPHPYPDHHRFTAKDICFQDDYPVLMTEKDAVKCRGIMDERHWILPIEASLNPLLDVRILTKLKELRGG